MVNSEKRQISSNVVTLKSAVEQIAGLSSEVGYEAVSISLQISYR